MKPTSSGKPVTGVHPATPVGGGVPNMGSGPKADVGNERFNASPDTSSPTGLDKGPQAANEQGKRGRQGRSRGPNELPVDSVG